MVRHAEEPPLVAVVVVTVVVVAVVVVAVVVVAVVVVVVVVVAVVADVTADESQLMSLNSAEVI